MVLGKKEGVIGVSSTFGMYSIAYSGMYANQAGLGAVSNNLANVNTTGASRVRVSSEEVVSFQPTGTVACGVNVSSIIRARDELLDANYRRQNTEVGYWSVKSGNLEYMQKILSEFETDDGTFGNGLQQTMTDYYNSWEELSKDPDSDANREQVIEASITLVSCFSEIDQQLQTLQQDARNGVFDGVDNLNNMAEQVAALNAQIAEAETGGQEASYLRDQRDALVDQMSTLANITVTETNGSYQVYVGGAALVDGSKAHKLVVKQDNNTAETLSVEWEDYDCKADITGGAIKAYLEDADGSGYEAIDTSNLADTPYSFSTDQVSSISTMRQALNDMITTIAASVNELHTSGFDANGDPGLPFFTAVDPSQPLSITNIEVNPAIVEDSSKVVSGASDASGDNTIAQAICDSQNTKMFEFDGITYDVNDFYKNFVSWIGTTGDNANSNFSTQSALVTQVDNQRLSVSGISSDEEMSNMIMYQNAYSASARVLSTIDQMLGDMINELGA